MKRILVITEANEKVASGHLMECIEIVEVLQDDGYPVSLLVNDDMPEAFQSRIPFPYGTYPKNPSLGQQAIREALVNDGVDLVIFNFRCIEDGLLRYIREDYRGIVLCIDELGHRHLSCDIIVNPMIDEYYHEYVDLGAKLYAGAKYLVLPRSIRNYHMKNKVICSSIRNVCVSMGGVDPFGTTLKLARWLPYIIPEAEINIVLGGGFSYGEELETIVKPDDRLFVHRNIDYIYDLFFDADVAFCAGGNSLHELACIGTPAIVIPSMPHEVRNGKTFEKNGFGICLKITQDIETEDVYRGVQECLSYQKRKSFLEVGKKLIDGNGAYEFLEVIS